VQFPKREEEFMLLDIEKARDGIAAGQSPFGAIIVRGGTVVAATPRWVRAHFGWNAACFVSSAQTFS
jgi:hypothetical protein